MLDIDGVVYSGGVICGNSQFVISHILLNKFKSSSAISKDGAHLPFVLMTNSGMQSEDDKLVSLRNKIKLPKYQHDNPTQFQYMDNVGQKDVELKHVIMSHTPISEYKFKNFDKNDPQNLDFTVILAASVRGDNQEQLCNNYKIPP